MRSLKTFQQISLSVTFNLNASYAHSNKYEYKFFKKEKLFFYFFELIFNGFYNFIEFWSWIDETITTQFWMDQIGIDPNFEMAFDLVFFINQLLYDFKLGAKNYNYSQVTS